MKIAFLLPCAICLLLSSCLNNDMLNDASQLKSLIGEYKGECVKISSGLDFETGIFYADTTYNTKTIKVNNISLDEIEVEGASWDTYLGYDNTAGNDTLAYKGPGTLSIYYNLTLIRPEKKLIYRRTQIHEDGPGGIVNNCVCFKD